MLPDTEERVVPAFVVGTTPYSWPWNGDLGPEATAVVVVAPTSDVRSSDRFAAQTILDNAMRVTDAVRAVGGTIIRVTTQPPLHGAVSTAQWFSDLVADDETTADGIDGFYGSALESLLRRHRIERIVLVGIGLETSVHSTMRSANDRGYECLLVIDACLAYDTGLIRPAVSMIEMSGGIFGAVGTAAHTISAFTPGAFTPGVQPIEGTPQ
ncbi:cysteine hydrolase [soil metagenome]